MKINMATFVLIITATSTALIAGLFYSYACSVNPGLGKLDDREYIKAMNAINLAILNPLFFASFVGTLVLLPLSTYLNYNQAHHTSFILLLIATLIYAIGVFGVTMFGNVPLNNALARVNINALPPEALAAHRLTFEKPWGLLHNVRTLANVASLVLVIISCCCERK